MAYFISEKQALASDRERSTYKPFTVEQDDCKRTEESINNGHPLYVSLCDISIIESISADNSVIYPIVPDGCTSIIFYNRDGINYGRLCGATDRLKKLIVYPHDYFLIFRFMPGTCEAFLNCDINDLTNKSVDVTSSIRNSSRLLQIAERDISVQWKALLMSRVLKVEKNEKETDYLIRYCTESILSNQGNIMVGDLAKKTGFSERYLGKIFERYIGLSPKTYAEIIRLQRSLKEIFNSSNNTSLLEIALDSGYFDHAHMNRSYNKFLNCSSGTLRKEGFSALDYNKVESYI